MQKFNLLPKISKLSSFFLVFISLFIIHYSLLVQTALAAPPCTKSSTEIGPVTINPDFHSLRPQPKDICGPEPTSTAYSCGNTLAVKEDFSVYPIDADSCTTDPNLKTKTCTFNVGRSLTLGVDTTNSTLPIAGLTETGSVVNSKSDKETVDDAQKINDYVSWYLNGTNNRAEGEFLGFQDAKDIDKLINYSGPLNKLLPWEVQTEARIAQVKAAGDTRHDQVAACIAGIPVLGGTFLGAPVPCYHQNLITGALTKPLQLSDWNGHLPPLPDDPKYKGKDFHIYWKDYLTWRGNFCTPDITIPIIKKKIYLCFPDKTDLFHPNYFASLFPYIPLSSTVDTPGSLTLQSPVNESGTDIKVSNIAFGPSSQTNTPLYFAHLQETPELADLLQKTYAAKGSIDGQVGDIPALNYDPATCKTLEIRSNTGDKLYGEKATSFLNYDASFTCTFTAVGTPSACLKTTQVAVPIQITAPNVDNLWTKTVAGTAAIFRRIFPKLGSGGLGSVIDMPTVAQAQYTASSLQSSKVTASPQNAELYIPHLGGVSEYFLKGIQAMLRPKGFGEAVAFGPGTESALACKSDDTDLDKAINDASKKYGVPAKLLDAIFRMEDGSEFLRNPKEYVCKENPKGAAGVMQIIPSTYEAVTCENERLDNSLACSEPGKLSRCVLHDALELGARTLMFHAGVWPAGSCTPSGKFPNNKKDIYNTACKYYNSFSPDATTIHAAQQFGLPNPETKNYCDVVCFLMGDCPPFP